MAILEGAVSGNQAEVTSTYKALRAALYPIDPLSYIAVSAQSGLITTIAANGPIFSFRNIGANPVAVRRVGVGFACTTAFGTAQAMGFGLMVARSFTASDSGGTAITITGNNGKIRTSLSAPTSVDCRISTTAALTAGTRTLDTNYLTQQMGWISGIGATIPLTIDNLYHSDGDDHPIILAQNEGIIIANTILMGATGVGNAFVNFEFAEITAYP